MCCEYSDDVILYLPRNLSYVQESYLDNYSVSAQFVHSQKATESEKTLSMYLFSGMAEEFPITDVDDFGSSVDPVMRSPCERLVPQTETMSSDTTDEEGVFINAMDDELHPLGSEINGKLNSSDDPSSDSVYSPDERDLEESQQGQKKLLEAAVKHIAEQELNGKNDLKIKINDKPFLETTTEETILKFDSTQSPVYEDQEFNFSRAELRKTSSLKTNKTPPGTPSRKKVVRFADAMGLDLESVRNIVNMDTPPRVPASALSDLMVGLEEDRKSMGSRYLTACFSQPGADSNFTKRVLAQKVCLENAVITGLTITGIIRVANISFNKMVRLRYSTNSWATFHDIAASYIQNSCDGPTDRFSFSVVAPADFGVGSRLEFAVSYAANCNVYWDNNNHKNYAFECFAKTVPTEAENSWMHFLEGSADVESEDTSSLQVPSQ